MLVDTAVRNVSSMVVTLLAVSGDGASFNVQNETALASSCSMSLSDALSCVWLYVYLARMFCSAGRNSQPKSSRAATSMLAMSVRTIFGVETSIPYVFMHAVRSCTPSIFALIFLQKSNTKLMTSSK